MISLYLLLLCLAPALAFLVLVGTLVLAVAWNDGSLIGKGGALIAATGAITLFAEWTMETEIDRRRRLAARYLSESGDPAVVAGLQRSIEIHVQKLRLPVVSVSAGLLAFGSLLQALGDFLWPYWNSTAGLLMKLMTRVLARLAL